MEGLLPPTVTLTVKEATMRKIKLIVQSGDALTAARRASMPLSTDMT